MDTFEFIYEGGKLEIETSETINHHTANAVSHETFEEEYQAFLEEIQRLNFIRYTLPKTLAKWGLITLVSFSLGSSLIQHAPEHEIVPVWNIEVKNDENEEFHILPLTFDENGNLVDMSNGNSQNSFIYGE